jgi:hypothetical protein
MTMDNDNKQQSSSLVTTNIKATITASSILIELSEQINRRK